MCSALRAKSSSSFVGTEHDAAAREVHHVVEGVEPRRLQHDLVAVIHERQDRDEERFLAAVRDDDLLGCVLEPVVAGELLADRVSELGQVPRGRCSDVCLPGAHERPSMHDRVGRVEVRIAPPERDHTVQRSGELQHAGADARFDRDRALGEIGHLKRAGFRAAG